MTSPARLHAPSGQRALFLTTAALPLAGWTIHVMALHRRASRDKLTGALRRESFEPQIQRFIDRHRDQALVLVCDVDDFKQFNDRYGHAVGDLVLATTGARIKAWAGSRGVVGRLGGEGGDEFIVAARVDPGRRTARLDQLNRALRQPVSTDDGRTVPVAVSIGAATPDVMGTRDRSKLMRAADVAMYDGKRERRGVAVEATLKHANAESVNGRHAGRVGTVYPVVRAV
ncbi:GGDEF domain-containing protein [Streptomyces scopuliridis]|uniref:GGDEF domain-containing protein n=1 Tax=Streptomyces scopuliridis TaxID=452529 RepID=UPI00368CF507